MEKIKYFYITVYKCYNIFIMELEPLYVEKNTFVTSNTNNAYSLIFNVKNIEKGIALEQEINSLIPDFPNDKCPSSNNTIIINNMIGQGSNGTIWLVTNSGLIYDKLGSIPVVLKRTNDITNKNIMSCNNLSSSANKIILYKCNDWLSEVIISALMSKLLVNNTSPHFLYYYAFYTCNYANSKNKNFKDSYNGYVLMQGVDTSFSEMLMNNIRLIDLKYKYNVQERNKKIKMFLEKLSIFLFQIFHTIYIMQYEYSMVHNDLHVANILVQNININTKYNGEQLEDIDYFEYIIGNKRYYVPNSNVLLKIVDFGYSAIYKEPQVISKRIHDKVVTRYGNTFNTHVDILYFFKDIVTTIDIPGSNFELRTILKLDKDFAILLQDIANAIFNIDINFENDDMLEVNIKKLMNVFASKEWYRSEIGNLPQIVVPYSVKPINVLNVFKKYEKPIKGIQLLGLVVSKT